MNLKIIIFLTSIFFIQFAFGKLALFEPAYGKKGKCAAYDILNCGSQIRKGFKKVVYEKSFRNKDSVLHWNKYWVEKILNLKTFRNEESEIHYFKNLESGDDYVLKVYEIDSNHIQISNGRTLNILIKPLKKTTIDSGYVVKIFKQYFRDPKDYVAHKRRTVSLKFQGKKEKDVKQGIVLHPKMNYWLYPNSVVFYFDKNHVLFDVEKEVLPYFSKAKLDPRKFVGGINWNDTNTFNQFSNNFQFDRGSYLKNSKKRLDFQKRDEEAGKKYKALLDMLKEK